MAMEKARLVKRLITKKIQGIAAPPASVDDGPQGQQDDVDDRVVLGGGVRRPVGEEHLGVVDVAGVGVPVGVADVEVPAEAERDEADDVEDAFEHRYPTNAPSDKKASVERERDNGGHHAERAVVQKLSSHDPPRSRPVKPATPPLGVSRLPTAARERPTGCDGIT